MTPSCSVPVLFLAWSVSTESRSSSTQLFFFQAEDGIRDPLVTGVQTCALPIFRSGQPLVEGVRPEHRPEPAVEGDELGGRSEERRVGKEWRWRWWADSSKKRWKMWQKWWMMPIKWAKGAVSEATDKSAEGELWS